MGQALEMCVNCETKRSCDTCTDLHNWIMEHLDAKQEWIDVHDRLPDKDTLVLCVGAKGGMFLGYVRYLYGDDKTAYVRVPNARSGRYAAFWMPLPEPPKEEE